MTAFAGFDMPLVYTSVREEHLAVREHCGVFDVSHMGEFIIKGREALDLIQLVTSNDASRLEIGQAQYSCLPNHEGGIVDDLLVYRLDEDQCDEGEQAYMLVVNASNIDKDFEWIRKHNSFENRLINISDQTGLLAVQGPDAKEVLQDLTDVDLSELGYYTFQKGQIAGKDNVLISATGYTGSGGFELYAINDSIVRIWDALFDKQIKGNVTPAGLGARDTLRLEKGFCLYGNDIDDTTSPIEAGLGWITKINKGHFHSQEIFAKQKKEGVVRKLVGFKLRDRRMPRNGYAILNEGGDEIGEVTSGAFSPSLEIPIGLGYVKKEFSKPGTGIQIVLGRKSLPGIIDKLPLLK